MNNIIAELDLACSSRLQIGLIGSLFFGFLVIGSIAMADYADKHGRMNAFLKVFPLVLIGSWVAAEADSLWELYFGMILIGAGS